MSSRILVFTQVLLNNNNKKINLKVIYEYSFDSNKQGGLCVNKHLCVERIDLQVVYVTISIVNCQEDGLSIT